MGEPTPKGEVVPFGKYKGQPVEVLLADEGYRDWLMSQDWFRNRFGNIYQTIINYGAEPQETPEHNEMQASFLDDEQCFRLARLLSRPEELVADQVGAGEHPAIADARRTRLREALEHPRIEQRSFEVRGWDVVYSVNWLGSWDDIRVELKPDLGEDFPAVLRQVKQYPAGRRRCVLVRRSNFQRVTWEQVAAMFAASGIRLLRESQLEAQAVPQPALEPMPEEPPPDEPPF
jgi:hypothetical protein